MIEKLVILFTYDYEILGEIPSLDYVMSDWEQAWGYHVRVCCDFSAIVGSTDGCFLELRTRAIDVQTWVVLFTPRNNCFSQTISILIDDVGFVLCDSFPAVCRYFLVVSFFYKNIYI